MVNKQTSGGQGQVLPSNQDSFAQVPSSVADDGVIISPRQNQMPYSGPLTPPAKSRPLGFIPTPQPVRTHNAAPVSAVPRGVPQVNTIKTPQPLPQQGGLGSQQVQQVVRKPSQTVSNTNSSAGPMVDVPLNSANKQSLSLNQSPQPVRSPAAKPQIQVSLREPAVAIQTQNGPVMAVKPQQIPETAPLVETSQNTTSVKPQKARTQEEMWANSWNEHVHGEKITDPSREKVILTVAMPQDNEIEPAAAEQMFASLVGLGKRPGKVFESLVMLFPQSEIAFKNPDDALSFELIADEKLLRFCVVVPVEWRDYMERQIHGAFPDAEVMLDKIDNFIKPEGTVRFAELNLKGKVYYPIRVLEDFETDPMSSITTTLSKLEDGERVILQYLLQPADDSWRKRGQQFVMLSQSPPKGEHDRKPNVDPSIIEGINTKIKKPGFRAVIRVFVQSKSPFEAESLLKNVTGAFDQYSQPHLAMFNSKIIKKTSETSIRDFITRSFPKWGNYPILNTLELATLYHFPNKEIKTPRIKWLRVRKSAPPTNIPTEGLYLGFSEFRNETVRVNLAREDRRRHMYILGQTGTGKSEFLKHLVYQDIVNGDGLAFIDPHGEAVEDILELIPKERAEDVIYFNPADSERPMGLNILDVKTEEQKHMTVNAFIGLLYKLYDPNHSGMVGPQLERAVRNVMLTAMSEEGNTMVEVLRLLTNPKFAEKKIPLVKDMLVKTYWTEQMAQTNEFHKSETLGYFVSKFDRFVTEKLMRNIIGQGKSAFNFREVMDNKKILLVNLSKGRLGEENSNFLGLLLIPRLLAAALSRADMPKEDRKDFFLYVDEFQNFATTDFAQILAEARKYRLNLVVANQFIAQIQEEIRNAVFGNVGTTICFRVGADDGEYMEKQFDPVFKQGDLINQAMGESICKLLIDGQPSRPFSFKTDWQEMVRIPKNPKIAQVIKEISRLKYGRDRSIVEREIGVRAGFE